MAKKVTEEMPETLKTTEEMPEVNETTEEMPEAAAIKHGTVKVLYEPKKHDWPGILNGMQVQPGEIHEVPYGAYLAVKKHPDYKLVE